MREKARRVTARKLNPACAHRLSHKILLDVVASNGCRGSRGMCAELWPYCAATDYVALSLALALDLRRRCGGFVASSGMSINGGRVTWSQRKNIMLLLLLSGCWFSCPDYGHAMTLPRKMPLVVC